MKDFGQLGKLGKFIQQSKDMQENLEIIREELAAIEVVGEAGGGMVRVTFDGACNAKSMEIDPLVTIKTDEDRAMLQDLCVAAFNNAREKTSAIMKEKQQEAMGGLPIPSSLKGFPF
ncbi:MAG: YbaB/EbfC family nucleoid-associated protein [Mariprofundales bacterium]